MSKNKLWQIFVSVLSLSILVITANSQETYSQNFDDFDNGETDLGDGSVIFGQAASIQDGRLQLTIDGQGLGFSSFSVPPIEGSSQGFTITFDYEIFDSPERRSAFDRSLRDIIRRIKDKELRKHYGKEKNAEENRYAKV